MIGIWLVLYKKMFVLFFLFLDELEFRFNVSYNWRSDFNCKRMKIDKKKSIYYFVKYLNKNFMYEFLWLWINNFFIKYFCYLIILFSW